ncbi:MAG TPA: DUF4349 domain-containing protein [Gemmatimonadaceae bacterium]|nr:DUF4349 domain-containing protein [Gemmatimonadaceae bacterium]
MSVLRAVAVASGAIFIASGCSRVQTELAVAPAGSEATLAVAGSTPTPAIGRQATYLVRRGWLDLTVRRPDSTAIRAGELTERLGGIVQNATVTEQRARLTLRVPEPRLDEALDSLSALGTVGSRRLSADDVSEQVVDLEARLASMAAVRDRLRLLLDRSVQVSEVLSVERELAWVQSEMDAMEARLRYRRSRAVMAELSLSANRERILGPVSLLFKGVGWAIGKLFFVS